MHVRIGRDSDFSQRLCLSDLHWKTVSNCLSHVSKSSHQTRHYYKEQHQQTVSCNQNVVKLSISCQNSRTCITLLHTNQLAHCCGNHTTPPRENKIQHSDVFSVSTTEPSDKKIMPFSRSNFHTHNSLLLGSTFSMNNPSVSQSFWLFQICFFYREEEGMDTVLCFSFASAAEAWQSVPLVSLH